VVSGLPEVFKLKERTYERPWGYNRSVLYLPDDKSVEFVEIDMAPGQETRPHYHERVTEHFYIVRGSAKFIINDRTYEVSEGDFVVVKPLERHKIVAGSEGVKILAVKKPGEEEDRIFVE
jgi:mannose-6-phosphate isomerase-like protein (cupin superfamily)